ncbi:MAG: hypothetical protein K2X01_03450 [Cyanobacteria bacterium]|nr:hypothetical protein [Cyanobacteriota bacterium]
MDKAADNKSHVRSPVVSGEISLFAFLSLLAIDVLLLLLEKIAALHAHGEGWNYFYDLLSHHYFWMAIALAPLQLWLWTQILKHVDLSLAYPLFSLSYPLSMVVAQWVLGETVSTTAWLGAGLITIGVGLLKDSPKHS